MVGGPGRRLPGGCFRSIHLVHEQLHFLTHRIELIGAVGGDISQLSVGCNQLQKPSLAVGYSVSAQLEQRHRQQTHVICLNSLFCLKRLSKSDEVDEHSLDLTDRPIDELRHVSLVLEVPLLDFGTVEDLREVP